MTQACFEALSPGSHSAPSHPFFSLASPHSLSLPVNCIKQSSSSSLPLASLTMDSLSQLPPECLQHILGILAHQQQAHALAALLSTNKNIALLILPYLYADPYRLLSHTSTNISAKRRAHNTPLRTRHTLILMLLARVPDARLPFLLRFALQVTSSPSTDSPASPSAFNYCSYIRHLNMDKDSIDRNKYWPQENPSPRLLELCKEMSLHVNAVWTGYCRPTMAGTRKSNTSDSSTA